MSKCKAVLDSKKVTEIKVEKASKKTEKKTNKQIIVKN